MEFTLGHQCTQKRDYKMEKAMHVHVHTENARARSSVCMRTCIRACVNMRATYMQAYLHTHTHTCSRGNANKMRG